MSRVVTMQEAVNAVAAKERRQSRTMQKRDDRLQRCFAILERAANAGDQCPTNETLMQLLGYASTSAPAGLVNLLEVAGMILVERSKAGRVVTICKSGKRTAGIIRARKASDWSADHDDILMDGVAEDVGFTAIGRIVGKSKNACISRFKKIAAGMGGQAR